MEVSCKSYRQHSIDFTDITINFKMDEIQKNPFSCNKKITVIGIISNN